MFGAIGIVFIREDEIEAFGRLTFVANFDFEFVAGLGCRRKWDDQFGSGGFEFCGRFIYRDTLNGEIDGVEGDFCGGVPEDRESVSDVADDLLLVGVKTEDDFGVLEVVVAAAGVRLVGAERACRCEKDHRGDGEDSADAMVSNLAQA